MNSHWKLNRVRVNLLEAPMLWPPDAKSWLTGKDTDAGKDWAQRQKGRAEREAAGRHHRPSGQASTPTPGETEGQGTLASCSPRGHRARHSSATEQQQSQVRVSGNMMYFFLVFSETDLSTQCNLDYLRTCRFMPKRRIWGHRANRHSERCLSV